MICETTRNVKLNLFRPIKGFSFFSFSVKVLFSEGLGRLGPQGRRDPGTKDEEEEGSR